MPGRENGWLGTPFRWVFGQHTTRKARQELRARLRRRRVMMRCVASHWKDAWFSPIGAQAGSVAASRARYSAPGSERPWSRDEPDPSRSDGFGDQQEHEHRTAPDG